MKQITLEVCANSPQSAIEAQRGGAIRVELCDNLREGGTTPALSQIEKTRQSIDIQLNTIIRPRGGDFYYTDIEFDTMKQDVHHCGKTKCDGVVFGILSSDGSIDKERNSELVNIARQYGMSITFHRAFDRANNLLQALEHIIELGFNRILTSGGMQSAPEGSDIIKKLIERANGRISIMPGGGITELNIYELVKATGLKEFHGSFRSKYKGKMKYLSPSFINEEEYTISQTDAEKVKKAIENANKI
ncbi:MAG: copper homeostasis protein CutC [Dysgonomonas sp.]